MTDQTPQPWEQIEAELRRCEVVAQEWGMSIASVRLDLTVAVLRQALAAHAADAARLQQQEQEMKRVEELRDFWLFEFFRSGIKIAREYGDNAHHLEGSQLERQFRRAMKTHGFGDQGYVQHPADAELTLLRGQVVIGEENERTLRTVAAKAAADLVQEMNAVERLERELNDARAENAALRAQVETLTRERDEAKQDRWKFVDVVMRDRRNIDGEPCPGCSGWGFKVYGSTATWRGGIGGQMMTSAVCDQCWGSGDASRPWPSWKAEAELSTLRDQLAQQLTKETAVEKEIVWYGPHACAVCGVEIVKAAMESGGAEFEPPARLMRVFRNGAEAHDPDVVYPMTWTPHVHREGAHTLSGTVAAPPVLASPDTETK